MEYGNVVAEGENFDAAFEVQIRSLIETFIFLDVSGKRERGSVLSSRKAMTETCILRV